MPFEATVKYNNTLRKVSQKTIAKQIKNFNYYLKLLPTVITNMILLSPVEFLGSDFSGTINLAF